MGKPRLGLLALGCGAGERWLESLRAWPEEFGLERMRILLRELGDPQLAYPSIHVVGTNGKSTTTRMIEAVLAAQGLGVGSTVSPHVERWSERIRVGGEEADFERALACVRAAADAACATQFETVTAAALLAFAEAAVDVAVVEAGLGGRLDATNVLRSPLQVLTNVALEHTALLGGTREAIAAEKLAVVRPGSTVVLGEPEWEELARASGAASVVLAPGGNLELAMAAASSFLGRPVDPGPAAAARLPGRLEQRGRAPLELWDGAHNPAGARYLRERELPRLDVIVASILADKDVAEMLPVLAELCDTLVATASSSPRALPAAELARLAAPHFRSVEPVERPRDAVRRARELAGGNGAVLVTGSLYLLAELAG